MSSSINQTSTNVIIAVRGETPSRSRRQTQPRTAIGWGLVPLMLPVHLLGEIAKPISLSLRLFGNIFAGGIMVALIALFPPYIMWAPNAIWKTFDLFVGLIQAFIFALLTILYFSQSMELDEEH